MQSASKGSTVADLREANKAADSTPQRGLVYKFGVLDWDDLISTLNQEDSVESQGARLICLGTPSLMSSDGGHVHLIILALTKVRRVCRSTLQHEAYTL